jgi:hypothetical protein
LFLDSGEQDHLGNKAHFSFELSWLRQEDFYEMASEEGASINIGITLCMEE